MTSFYDMEVDDVMMTYEAARAFIEATASFGSRPGLETITELLNRIGNPQERLKVVHVTGTNGKGSTAAYISAILAFAGYKVGRYLSPAVFEYREKIQVTHKVENQLVNDYITEEKIAEAISVIKPACEAMVRDGFYHPTSFEIETAMAFLYLYREQVDIAVIEVGMGGRLDATNVIRHPLCCVITSISMDHMQYLGDTIEKIAGEKAGIIKKGAPVVTGNTDPRVIAVLQKHCGDNDTTLTIASRDAVTDISYSPEETSFTYRGQKMAIGLLGDYQIDNAVIAIEAAKALHESGYPISDAAIREGLRRARWRGRLELISDNPYFIIDGAHNEDAAIRLREALMQYFPGRNMIFIMGVLADKDYRRILELTAPLAGLIIIITPPSNRALASERLAAEAKKYTDKPVIDAGTVSRAVRLAYEKAGKDDVILAFGSLSFLGEIVDLLSK